MRIIYNGNRVIARVDNDAVQLVTPHTVFTGTADECLAEIARLKLATPGPQNRRIDDQQLVTGHLPQATS